MCTLQTQQTHIMQRDHCIPLPSCRLSTLPSPHSPSPYARSPSLHITTNPPFPPSSPAHRPPFSPLLPRPQTPLFPFPSPLCPPSWPPPHPFPSLTHVSSFPPCPNTGSTPPLPPPPPYPPHHSKFPGSGIFPGDTSNMSSSSSGGGTSLWFIRML